MWTLVGKTTDITEGGSVLIEAAAKKIAVFNVAGKFYALANTCPHRGGPLAEGHVEGQEVTCPWHAWNFDLVTGECRAMNVKQPVFRTKVEGEYLYVEP